MSASHISVEDGRKFILMTLEAFLDTCPDIPDDLDVKVEAAPANDHAIVTIDKTQYRVSVEPLRPQTQDLGEFFKQEEARLLAEDRARIADEAKAYKAQRAKE